MKAKYSSLFKDIIKAYYDGNLEEKVNSILEEENIDKNQLSAVISSLCGVELSYSKNYIKDLKKAIEEYTIDHKIVNKVKSCSLDCSHDGSQPLCQKSCPFNAIFFDKENNTTYIDDDRCTDCGLCVEACPTGGILDKVEFLPFAHLLKGDTPVIAAVAPAIQGQFGEGANINKLRTAFKKMGFSDMIEVAFFADMLTLKEAVEFDEHVKEKDDFMITSCCCPMWVGMLKRVYEGLVKHVSPSVSPMIAAGRVLKALNPNCKVVFIGPCIAKKAEAKEKDLLGDIDYVLTFQELKEIFDTLDIHPETMEEDPSSEYASRGGRLYARTGGVSIAVSDAIERLFPEKHKMLTAVQANGVRECKEMLEKAQKGEIAANFIEGMGCIGGCVGGPKAIINRELGREKVNEFADASEIKVPVDSDCMKEILNRLNINSEEDFKNKTNIEIFERKF